MFPVPIKWTNDASGGVGPATQPSAGLDFAVAYAAALEEVAASQAWLDNKSGDNESGGEPSPSFPESSLLESFPSADRTCTSSSSQNRALPSVSLRDDLPGVPSVLNKNQLADWMDSHALARSSHRCAMYCRQGMEAAGLATSDRPRSGDAADYGPFLLRHGAQVVPSAGYTAQVGDTVVFDRTEQHPNGHMEIYDGRQWVSDFLQHSFSPYRDAGTTPSFTIYRLS